MKSRNKRPLILTVLENYEYQELLELVDADFLLYEISAGKRVYNKYSNARALKDLTPNIKPDIFLCQNKLTHYRHLYELAVEHNKPLICVSHEVGTNEKINHTFGLQFSKEIFYSKNHSQSWENENFVIIPPTNNKKINITTNIYINYNNTLSGILEIVNAMGKGKCVLSKPILEANNVIKHGYNGFFYNNENDIKTIKDNLTKNPELLNEICSNAARSIESNESFSLKWNQLLYNYF